MYFIFGLGKLRVCHTYLNMLLNEGHIRPSYPISTAPRTSNMKYGIIIWIFAFDIRICLYRCTHVCKIRMCMWLLPPLDGIKTQP